LCDVYEGCLTILTAFFSIVPKLVLLFVLLRFTYIVFNDFSPTIGFFFLTIGLLSIFVSSFLALYQKRLKRLLGYSTVSHLGFVYLAISLLTLDSLKSSFIYLFIYISLSLIVFSTILLISDNENFLKYILNWTSLASKNKPLILCFVIAFFSMAGIPPLSGFYSKLNVLFSLLSQQYVLISFFVVLFSCVSCFFYIRLIKVLSFTTTAENSN
jgi:NADH-quinone oxidoreductase subunit N